MNQIQSTRADRRRERTRKAILDAAEESFAAGGLQAARMDEIAERADVGVGTIYLHFGSKEGLVLGLVERALVLFKAYMMQAYDASESPLERVMAAGDAYLRFHLEHPGMFRYLATGVTRPSEAHDHLESILDEFAAHIAAAIAAGEARAELDPHRVSRFLWGAWNGVIALGDRDDAAAISDDEIAESIQTGREIVLHGMANGPRADARLIRVPGLLRSSGA